MEKPDESHTEEEQERNRLLSIDIRRVNAPLKSAKVLVDRGYGCESGSEGTTISVTSSPLQVTGLPASQRLLM